MKTEPATFSWEDLVRDGRTVWDGVRNHQAAKNMRSMKKGDFVFVYHSGHEKGVVGIAKVTKEAYPDPTAKEGSWVVVDLVPVKALRRRVSLAEIKAVPALSDMKVVRQGRLSVSPVSAKEWKRIVKMGGARK